MSAVLCLSHTRTNRIDGVMVNVLASIAVIRGFELGRVKIKTIKLVSFDSPLGAALRRERKDWLAWN